MKKVFKQLKYKSLLRIRDIIYPKKRILNFKRPKWSFLKKKFFFKFIKRQGVNANKFKGGKPLKIFHNQFILHSPLRWVYLRSSYRSSLFSKTRFSIFYQLKTPIKKIKNYNVRYNLLPQIESRLDVCLWRAGFFESPAVARFFINHQNINVNDSVQNLSKITIKEGDIISVKKKAKNYVMSFLLLRTLGKRNNKFVIVEKFKLLYMLAPYLEVNPNTLDIVCVKPYIKELSVASMYNTNLDLPAFKNYLRQL